MSSFPPCLIFPLSFISQHEYSKESSNLPSLLLDTVMRGRPRRSRSMMFQLPAEILAKIIDLLEDDEEALASLALVNSDCRYLARARQFTEIHFDYSPQSDELLRRIVTESLGDTDEAKPSFPIGVCVRKVTSAPLREFFWKLHRELCDRMYLGLGGIHVPSLPHRPLPIGGLERSINELQTIAQAHYNNYRKLLVTAVASKMPNVDVLVWKDQVGLDGDFIEILSRCSAKHVKLEGIKIAKSWPARLPDSCSVEASFSLPRCKLDY